jgi:hypothetical protein
MSVDQLKNTNRIVVHRYSRVVYYRALLLGMRGSTEPVITAATLASLRALAAGGDKVTPDAVRGWLRELKLSARYRRHAVRIAVIISDGDYKPPVLESIDFFALLTLFRRVEHDYDHGGKRSLPEARSSFYSYMPLHYQLCVNLDLMHMTSKQHLLKSTQRQRFQHLAFGRCAKRLKIEKDLDVLYSVN